MYQKHTPPARAVIQPLNASDTAFLALMRARRAAAAGRPMPSDLNASDKAFLTRMRARCGSVLGLQAKYGPSFWLRRGMGV